MKIIVDTNIVFSAILNSDNNIGDLIISSENQLQLYSSDYLRFELNKHHQKLKKISKLSDYEIQESKYRILKNIHFINIELIPEPIWLGAEDIVRDIDIDDIDFVALTIFLNAYLWTGDKFLYNGLKKKGFMRVNNTSELWNKEKK
ncbi:MAG: hypothetical protein QG635_1731 [Bacteroidota bacterium]|nr:hypothetical protein [Bacteroidota bacterium]